VITAYVSIGNSDDKLTQREWSAFLLRTHLLLDHHASTMHGAWYSGPGVEWQNACWCIEIHEDVAPTVKGMLARLAREFRQDSIAWAEAQTTFIGAAQ
jgi:hypothetical protein